MSRTAIIAGSGALPLTLADALTDPVFVTLTDVPAPAGVAHVRARVEKLGQLFKILKAENISDVTFAGAMARPKINPLKLDRHAMRLALSLGKGDDALLREVIALFEEQGFAVKAADEICPSLTLPAGTRWGRQPSDEEQADIARAAAILAALAPHDVGQGAVCAGGQVLGIETLQGTDALLRFVGETPEALRRAPGVFVKAPKAGQDMRIDMPTIGIQTAEHVIAAGLGGIAIPAGQVLVLEPEALRARIEEAGLFLIAT